MCTPFDVRNVRFAEQDPFFQSSGLVGIESGDQSASSASADVSTPDSADMSQLESGAYPQYADGQFATFQSRGGFSNGR